MLLGARSECHWLRIGCARLGHLLPHLPRQLGYHIHLTATAPVLAAAFDHLTRHCSFLHHQVRLIGATLMPYGASLETARRCDLAGWANYGYCPVHWRWYWGLELYLITVPDGMPVT